MALFAIRMRDLDFELFLFGSATVYLHVLLYLNQLSAQTVITPEKGGYKQQIKATTNKAQVIFDTVFVKR